MAKRRVTKNAPKSSAPKKRRLNTSSDPDDQTTLDFPLQSSGLLLLPREIRDMIYGHVLETDRTDNWCFYEDQHGEEISIRGLYKLKKVCRKLYRESASLEDKLGTLIMNRFGYILFEPEIPLLRLGSLGPPAMFTRIKCIEVYYKVQPPSLMLQRPYFLKDCRLDEYVRIAEFCRLHPGIEVRYVFGSFSSIRNNFGAYPEQLISEGIVLLKALRNVDVSYLQPNSVHAQENLEFGAHIRGGRQVSRWYAPNLRFFLNYRRRICEDDIRRYAERNDVSVPVLEKWIEAIRSWAEDGF